MEKVLEPLRTGTLGDGFSELISSGYVEFSVA